MDNIIYYTPLNFEGEKICNSWLIKVDTLNKILEWRHHWRVDTIPEAQKKLIERQVEERWPDCNWLKLFTAIGKKGKPSSETVWATSKKDASLIFDEMKIDYTTLKIVD